MKPKHGCIATEMANYRRIAKIDDDATLLHKVRDWKEFQRPMYEHNRLWRAFIGIMQREAYRRDIWAPE